MYSLHSPSVHLHSFHSSVPMKITHILREKKVQKPEVIRIYSTQLLSMVTELNKSRCSIAVRKMLHFAKGVTVMMVTEMQETLLETVREISTGYFWTVMDEGKSLFKKLRLQWRCLILL